MKPRAIIFFDLDGTLLIGPNQIDESSLEAIKLLRQAGYLLLLQQGGQGTKLKVYLNKRGLKL